MPWDTALRAPPTVAAERSVATQRVPLSLFAPFRRLGSSLGQQSQSPLLLAVQCSDSRRSERNFFVRQNFFAVRRPVFLVDEAGIEITGHKPRMAQDPLVKRNVGLDAAHL